MLINYRLRFTTVSLYILLYQIYTIYTKIASSLNFTIDAILWIFLFSFSVQFHSTIYETLLAYLLKKMPKLLH